MAISHLQLHSEFTLYGRKHRVMSIDPPKVWIKRSEDDEQFEIEFNKLVTHPTFVPGDRMKREIEHEERRELSVLSTLSEKQREKVSQRFAIVHPLALLDLVNKGDVRAAVQFNNKYASLLRDGETISTVKQKTLIERIVSTGVCSKATLLRWYADYKKEELSSHGRGIEGLVSRAGKGYTGRKDMISFNVCHPKNPDLVLDVISIRSPGQDIEKQYLDVLNQVIAEYLSKIRLSVKELHRRSDAICMKNSISPIPYNTLREIIGRIDNSAISYFRHTKDAQTAYDPVARGFANSDALYPYNMIQIDHTIMDIQVVDEQTGEVIDRPWLSLGIDVYSRMPWGYYLSFEDPSANVVKKVIQHGVCPKNTKEKYGTQKDWVLFGIPDIIYVDNGPDFKSGDIKALVEEVLESQLMHRPVRTPHYGSVIERLFGTLNSTLIHSLPGTSKSNPKDLGEYESEKQACLTLQDLHYILNVYFTDIYPQEIHTGLQSEFPTTPTPEKRYFDGLKIGGNPRWIDANDMDYYKIEFMGSAERQFNKDGVHFRTRIYFPVDPHPELLPKDSKHQSVCKIKHDVDDISTIYLKNNKTNEYIELRCVVPSFEKVQGMNEYTYKKIRDILKAEGLSSRGGEMTDDR